MSKKKPKKRSLDLRILESPPGLPALSTAAGASLAEAAAVCLEYNGHESGVNLRILDVEERAFIIEWNATTEQIRRTHNDLQDATEHGACAVGILVTIELTGLTVIQRGFNGNGFDYWLGDDPHTLFQNMCRLEVSGILKGDERKIRARVRQKTAQTKKSDSMKIPAYVCVVEFGRPQTYFAQR